MTPYTMLVNEGDVPGDCLRTCIASLLDMGPIAVPHFLADNEPDGAVVWDRVRKWLATQQLGLWMMAYPGDVELDDVLLSVGLSNPDTYYMIGGFGAYSEHIVIALNDKIVHDPSRLSPGLTRASDNGFWLVAVLIPSVIRKS